MLDQVALARPVLTGVGDHAPDGIELLVAGEDQTGRAPAVAVLILHFLNELADQVEDAVPRPDLVPEVVRGVSALSGRDGRIAGAAELAAVEGQGAGLRASEVRGDIDPVRVDGEVREAAAVGEERFAGVAVVAVLQDRLLDVLAVSGFLSSAVQKGMPLRKRAMSTLCSVFAL